LQRLVNLAEILLGVSHATILSRRLVDVIQTSRGRLVIRHSYLLLFFPSFFVYVVLLFFLKKEKVQECGPSLSKLQLSMVLTLFIQ